MDLVEVTVHWWNLLYIAVGISRPEGHGVKRNLIKIISWHFLDFMRLVKIVERIYIYKGLSKRFKLIEEFKNWDGTVDWN